MVETGTIKNPECVIEIDRQWKAFKSNTYSSFGFWFSVLSSAAEKKKQQKVIASILFIPFFLKRCNPLIKQYMQRGPIN